MNHFHLLLLFTVKSPVIIGYLLLLHCLSVGKYFLLALRLTMFHCNFHGTFNYLCWVFAATKFLSISKQKMTENTFNKLVKFATVLVPNVHPTFLQSFLSMEFALNRNEKNILTKEGRSSPRTHSSDQLFKSVNFVNDIQAVAISLPLITRHASDREIG